MILSKTNIFPIYFGWIPCVSGRLSFSVCGKFCETIDRKYYRHGKILGLYCSQNRNLRDGIFSRPGHLNFLASVLTSRTEDLYFEFLGSSFKCNNGTFTEVNGAVSIRIGSPIHMSDSINYEDQIFSVKFHLKRNGECTFFSSLISENVTWDADSNTKEVAQYLTSQCYMFVRDLMHRHRHHEATSDTIIKIHSRHGKLSWRLKVCYDLMRYVVKYTSGSTPKSYNNSLGTLSYMESFMSLLSESEKNYSFSNENLNSLKGSLKSERERAVFKTTKRLWAAGSIVPAILALLFYVAPSDPSPIEASLVVAITSTLLFYALLYTKIVPYQRIRPLLWLRELSFSINKFYLSVLLFILSSILFLIGLYVISLAY